MGLSRNYIINIYYISSLFAFYFSWWQVRPCVSRLPCREPRRGSNGAWIKLLLPPLCSSSLTLTSQRWFMTPASRHSQQTHRTGRCVCVLCSRDWLSCLSCLWHFWNVISPNSMKGVRPRRKAAPRPTSAECSLSVCPRLRCICIPLLRHARKLNSHLLPPHPARPPPSSCKTLPGIKPSLCDLL